MADTAELWWKLAGRADNGVEEALSDLQQVSLVLLQVFTLFQSKQTNTSFSQVHTMADEVVGHNLGNCQTIYAT